MELASNGHRACAGSPSSLFAQTTTLPGIGPWLGKLIETVAGGMVASLCWHLPTGVIDRRFSPKPADAPEGVIVMLIVTVISICRRPTGGCL